MIWNILVLIILIVWIVAYLKNKRSILSLPYFLMIFITPIYNILDQKFFVEIFGCGCVPYTQTNANDLRQLVYNILAIVITILGIFLLKKIESKKTKVIYITTVFIFNFLLAYKICQLYMWA